MLWWVGVNLPSFVLWWVGVNLPSLMLWWVGVNLPSFVLRWVGVNLPRFVLWWVGGVNLFLPKPGIQHLTSKGPSQTKLLCMQNISLFLFTIPLEPKSS